MRELAKWMPRWKIIKFLDDFNYKNNTPYDIVDIEGNLLLNVGITQVWDLVSGLGGTAYSNANAYLGVGDSTTAAVATQTGLLGTNTAYVAMDTSYPSLSAETLTWQSTFNGTTGNFAWNEFTVLNGPSGTGTALNRLVSAQGTKASGQTWTLQLAITLS